MTRQEVEKWLRREPEAKELNEEEFEHVVECMYHICLWYEEGLPLGDFLTAVLKNNFMEACGRADDANRKVLFAYVKFIYNNVPVGYRQKIKGGEKLWERIKRK